MDFVDGLPCNAHGFDSIWVTMDQLTKSSHFLPIQTPYSAKRLTRIYIKKVVHLHGIPLSVISD